MTSAGAPRRPTGARRLLVAAAQAGVRICFANPGTTEMWLVSALDDLADDIQNPIRSVLCLHETVCSGAADGYARMSRSPAMALLHLGPGLSNALANLHNARRARSPVLCVVGDMASWHVHADPLLNTDIMALARTVSRTVVKPIRPPTQGGSVDWSASALQLLQSLLSQPPSPLPPSSESNSVPGWALSDGTCDSRVITLIIPHDVSWEEEVEEKTTSAHQLGSGVAGLNLQGQSPSLPPQVIDFIKQCAAALISVPRGKAAIYLGGQALLADNEAIRHAGMIAAACGAALLGENAFARVDRGAGLAHVTRLPYFPQEAARELARYEMLVTVDARLPVANFGYQGGPSHLVPDTLISNDRVWELDTEGLPAGSIPVVLATLARELGAHQKVTPGVNCGGVFPLARSRVERPAAGVRLSPQILCQCVAALQPEGCIIVDESLTSGGPYWDMSKACPPFSHLTLTGGAIGSGMPMALGAALACPTRCVINLQADGSAMYALQALWSQARERAHVITIICANNTYNILRVECARQRLPGMGPATRLLTDLGQPIIDWVSLAQGMGLPAERVTTAGELCVAMERAMGKEGPSLIQAQL